ncbi:hypothetical protein B0T16DRAFT_420570 [Cercophora newfieldiana]|uniref:Uncharacterized protein n=1 Tax=Cercophora newfieldiana TaxID=92897 RepID=A0AA39XX02_9PEZI|nr:hypothetical protein B0T16DRAFT_420570 [Cercophora newfieldiana]
MAIQLHCSDCILGRQLAPENFPRSSIHETFIKHRLPPSFTAYTVPMATTFRLRASLLGIPAKIRAIILTHVLIDNAPASLQEDKLQRDQLLNLSELATTFCIPPGQYPNCYDYIRVFLEPPNPTLALTLTNRQLRREIKHLLSTDEFNALPIRYNIDAVCVSCDDRLALYVKCLSIPRRTLGADEVYMNVHLLRQGVSLENGSPGRAGDRVNLFMMMEMYLFSVLEMRAFGGPRPRVYPKRVVIEFAPTEDWNALPHGNPNLCPQLLGGNWMESQAVVLMCSLY